MTIRIIPKKPQRGLLSITPHKPIGAVWGQQVPVIQRAGGTRSQHFGPLRMIVKKNNRKMKFLTIMKQHSIFSFALATILSISFLAVSCQKEETVMGTVTLGAKMQEPVGDGGKAYIDGYTPCWHNGDRVYINDAAYAVVAASGASAQIENVTASSSYRAVFPAAIVTPGTDISVNSSIPVMLPAVQRYELVGGHQRVDVPMGAFLTGGSTLQFHNLCSIVRVTVSNSLNQELPLRHLALRTDAAMLSGVGTATVSGQLSDRIEMSTTASHSVCLGFAEDGSMTIQALGSKTFDIVVPAFATDNITFTLYTTDGYYSEMTKTNKALAHNTITTVTMNVTSLTQIVTAELVDGPTFNAAIPDNATAVVFEYNNPSVTSGTLLSTTDSPTPIYGNLVGTTWRVSTAADIMNANPNCNSMFYSRHWGSEEHLLHLESIDFGEGFNTSNVTSMRTMFDGCEDLTNLDVSHFNTENVTNMYGMFWHCRNLTNLDLSNFNTSNVTDMTAMFGYCRELTNLDLSNFNTPNVTTMCEMFNFCTGLISLDVSSFNTSSVTEMMSMFSECSSLTSLDVSHFNTSNTIYMSSMFNNCSSLTSLDVSNFNTANVRDMAGMFSECSSLTSLDVSHFNTSNVTDMYRMFYSCSALSSLDVSHFNTSNVTDMGCMFHYCSGLTSLDVSNFNTSNVTDMYEMFSGCRGLTSLDVSHFNTSSVTRMSWMFDACIHLTSLDLSNFNTENVTDMQRMFQSCWDLTQLNIANFNTENVTNMEGMFSGCGSLSSLDVTNFNTEKVTDIGSIFAGCASLTSLDITHFNTSRVTNMYGMFLGCTGLTRLDLSNFNTSIVTDMRKMFYACRHLTNLDLSNFDLNGLGTTENDITYYGKECMCEWLSDFSGTCTITCPSDVENAIKEVDNDYNPSNPDHQYYYISGLPTSGVTFTWVRPTTSK